MRFSIYSLLATRLTCMISRWRCSVWVEAVPDTLSSDIFSLIVDNLSSICSISVANVSKTHSPRSGAVSEPEWPAPGTLDPTLLMATNFRSISFSRCRAAFLRSAIGMTGWQGISFGGFWISYSLLTIPIRWIHGDDDGYQQNQLWLSNVTSWK